MSQRNSQLNLSVVFLTTGFFVAVLLLTGLYFFNSEGNTFTFASNGQSESSSDYQAVFLDNGQVYFGSIIESNESEVHLSDPYYLRVNDSIEEADNVEADLSLIKRAETLHGPEPVMFFNRDHVLFIENLSEESQVVQAILSDS